MKKYLLVLLVVVGTFGVSHAVQAVTYNDDLVNGSNLVSDADYSLDLGVNNIDNLSFQAVYSVPTYYAISCTTMSVNPVLETIASTQAYPAGYAVLYVTSTFNGSGLKTGTTYFAFPAATGYISLATTKANAILGTAINISTGTQGGTFTLTPVDIVAASPFGFAWQVSNDNTNWYALNVASVSILQTTTATNYLWDFGVTTYRYIRAHFTSSAFGAVNLKLRGYGKR